MENREAAIPPLFTLPLLLLLLYLNKLSKRTAILAFCSACSLLFCSVSFACHTVLRERETFLFLVLCNLYGRIDVTFDVKTKKTEDKKFWLFARPPPLFCPALPSPLFCRAVTPIPLCSSHSLSQEHKRVDTVLLFKYKSSTVASQLTHGRNIPTDLTRRLPLFHIPCG